MRLAAVDIGSNTVHALVVDVVDGRLEEVSHFVEMPSLGAEVARTGRIGAPKSAEAVAALEAVVGQARALGFEHLVAGATAAVRRAADQADFLRRCSDAIGVPVRLLSSEREAQLGFAGVAGRHAVRRQWLMADLGGGSTQLVVAHHLQIEAWRSLPIGSGVLASKHLSDPPREGEREALRTEAVALLKDAPECEPSRLVATGGTASNLPRVVSPTRPPTLLSRQAVIRAADLLDRSPAAALEQRYLLRPGRVPAMRGGVEVLLLLLDWAGLDRVHISLEGLRQGMILAYLALGEDWYQDQVPAPPVTKPDPAGL
jgi:exopolyphosphatase / guanosine-5'-triphosphate,3'-diphosphate pyrophosphatase